MLGNISFPERYTQPNIAAAINHFTKVTITIPLLSKFLNRSLEEVSAYIAMTYSIAHALAATNTKNLFKHFNKTRRYIPMHSVSSRGEKSLIVVSWVKGPITR
jgi:hypothetical protein